MVKKIYVVGIGPGDPALMTFKAAQLIRSADRVFCLRAESADSSFAGSILKAALGSLSNVEELVYPLSRDSSELGKAWYSILTEIAARLPFAGIGVFPTLGDPSLYSTGAYIKQAAERIPGLQVEFVPGVSSPSAAAAAAEILLASGDSPCSIVPAPEDPAELDAYLGLPGVLAIMKIGRRYKSLASYLRDCGLAPYCSLVVRTGTSEEAVYCGLPDLEKADMATLLIDNKKRFDRE